MFLEFLGAPSSSDTPTDSSETELDLKWNLVLVRDPFWNSPRYGAPHDWPCVFVVGHVLQFILKHHHSSLLPSPFHIPMSDPTPPLATDVHTAHAIFKTANASLGLVSSSAGLLSMTELYALKLKLKKASDAVEVKIKEKEKILSAYPGNISSSLTTHMYCLESSAASFVLIIDSDTEGEYRLEDVAAKATDSKCSISTSPKASPS